MSILDHLAQAAATLLLLELLVVLFIVLGITGGLAWGLHWVNGKTGWAFGKVNTYVGMGQRYIRIGTDYAAKPFIAISGLAENLKGTAKAMKATVQGTPSGGKDVAARRVSPGAIPPESIAYAPEAQGVTTAEPLIAAGTMERR